MLKKLNEKKIINSIKENGYYIINNYYNKNDLEKIKSSLLKMLNYVKKSKERNLQKKYYEVKKYSPILKSHWYDLATKNIDMLQLLHNPQIVNLIKKFFKTDVLLSGRPAIHVHDDKNLQLLDPHQETHQISRDSILLWSSLYDTNKEFGGLTVYKDSHKHGYFKHTLEHPRLGKKSWTKKYTHVDPKIASRFEKMNLEIKAGAAVLMHSSCLHSSYPLKKKNFVRIVITERYNPLLKIPYLKKEKAPITIPYMGVDYNKIKD